MLRALPSTPRCGFCGAPFHGLGGRLVRPRGYRPFSRKNRAICSVCVELAFPGRMAFDVGTGIEWVKAFVGNIGDTAVHDFTAVGDVVDTAAYRLRWFSD